MVPHGTTNGVEFIDKLENDNLRNKNCFSYHNDHSIPAVPSLSGIYISLKRNRQMPQLEDQGAFQISHHLVKEDISLLGSSTTMETELIQDKLSREVLIVRTFPSSGRTFSMLLL